MNQNPFFRVALIVCMNDEEAYDGQIASVGTIEEANAIAASFCTDNRWQTVTPAIYLDSEECTGITVTIEEHDEFGDFDEVFREPVYRK